MLPAFLVALSLERGKIGWSVGATKDRRHLGHPNPPPEQSQGAKPRDRQHKTVYIGAAPLTRGRFDS